MQHFMRREGDVAAAGGSAMQRREARFAAWQSAPAPPLPTQRVVHQDGVLSATDRDEPLLAFARRLLTSGREVPAQTVGALDTALARRGWSREDLVATRIEVAPAKRRRVIGEETTEEDGIRDDEPGAREQNSEGDIG